MAEYILRADHIQKSFGGVHALKEVSLHIRKGEVHCLAGENGCGKSTLIKIISGFYTADAGTLELDGRRYAKITPAEAIAAGIQVIYQDFSVFPNLTVMENLALNNELSNKRKIVSWKRLRATAKQALAKIGVQMDLDELVENLSVADKQLVAICRALLRDAKLIIMDEPTTALTKREVSALFEIIRQLQGQGIAILFVSHKMDEVFEISQRFTILRSGKNVFSGNTDELDEEKFTYYMTGRHFEDTVRAEPLESNRVVLETRGLTLTNAFYDVSFSLKKGEILGIAGLLGSGRTELVQTLFGFRQATCGEILLEGRPVQVSSVSEAIAHGIGYVPEDRLTEGLFLPRSIRNNIVVTKYAEMAGAFGVLNQKRLDAEAQRWIRELSIVVKDDALPVQTLSGGNQQKVVLARWLATELKVLILNGPTVGVDIGAKHDLYRIFRELARQGLSIIVISDDLPEILSNCHRVLIMTGGRMVAESATDEINQNELDALATTA